MIDVLLVLIGWLVIISLPIIWVLLIAKLIFQIINLIKKSHLNSEPVFFSYKALFKKIFFVLFSFFSGVAMWTFYLPILQGYAMNSFADLIDNEIDLAKHLPKYGYLVSSNMAADLIRDPSLQIVQTSYHELIDRPNTIFLSNTYIVIRVKNTVSMNAGTIAYRIDDSEWFHIDIMTLEGGIPIKNDPTQYRTIVVPAPSVRVPLEDEMPKVDVRWIRFYKTPKLNIPYDPNFDEK